MGAKIYQASIPIQIQKTLTAGTWDTTNVLLSNTESIENTYSKLPYTNNFA